ncbi:MAG: hypothetical protein LBP20_08410 [Treponema sp.]|jgi:hypothetical protein|nr:hypothetical protein [Treponema sp.]
MSGMSKRVNLHDNIFILCGHLKILRDTLNLDTDPAMFVKKVMEDTEFLDQTLEMLLEYLRTHDRLFERDEALNYLSDLEWDFSRFLAEFSGSTYAASYPELQERIRPLRERGAERLNVIGEDRKTTVFSLDENTVSSDELNELLQDF